MRSLKAGREKHQPANYIYIYIHSTVAESLDIMGATFAGSPIKFANRGQDIVDDARAAHNGNPRKRIFVILARVSL